MVIACPKLDDTEGYVEKLTDLIRLNHPASVTVAIMTVPCCTGLERMVRTAVQASQLEIPVQTVIVGIDGEIVRE
jgi:hypothetical protein